jgi:hypothetical protein
LGSVFGGKRLSKYWLISRLVQAASRICTLNQANGWYLTILVCQWYFFKYCVCPCLLASLLHVLCVTALLSAPKTNDTVQMPFQTEVSRFN